MSETTISDLKEKLEDDSNATRRNLNSIGAAGFADMIEDFRNEQDSLMYVVAALGLYIMYVAMPEGKLGAYMFVGGIATVLPTLAILTYVSPGSLSIWKWAKYSYGFRFGDTRRSAINGDSGRMDDDSLSTEGRRHALEDLSRVDGVSRDADGFWRFDGEIVGGVGVDSAELSLAEDETWESAADELGDTINTLNIAGQMRSAALRVDTDEPKKRANDRINDPDVANNPNLKSNVGMYKFQLPVQLEQKNASIRGFQMTFSVGMDEVQLQHRRVFEQLSDVPYIGDIFESIGSDLTLQEIRYRQERLLQERREKVALEMEDISGCDADELDLDQLTDVFEESWTGRPATNDGGTNLRSIPIISMEREYTDTDDGPTHPAKLSDSELDEELLGILSGDRSHIDDDGTTTTKKADETPTPDDRPDDLDDWEPRQIEDSDDGMDGVPEDMLLGPSDEVDDGTEVTDEADASVEEEEDDGDDDQSPAVGSYFEDYSDEVRTHVPYGEEQNPIEQQAAQLVSDMEDESTTIEEQAAQVVSNMEDGAGSEQDEQLLEAD